MAYPSDRLPVKVFLAPGADLTDGSAGWVWTDITSSVRLQPGIRITQGRADESARVAPSTCRLMLDNRTGDFTPRNPLGTYYGSLGRNTPLRVAIRLAEDGFARTASNGWGTEPLWGGSWTTSGGSASDYSVSSGKGNIASSTTNVLRASLIDVGVTDARITVDVVCPVVPTGDVISHWVIGRAADASNFYTARLDINTSGSVDLRIRKVVSGVATALAVASAIGTHSAGDTWRVVFEYRGSNLRAKAWEPSATEPSAWQVETTDTDITSGSQAGAGVRLETGNTNGTQTVTFDGFTVDCDRFSGFVSSWPPRWDKSGNDCVVPIEANGILRRLNQGTPPSLSPMRRSIPTTDPVAYWPCEDGSAANWAASAMIGHSPLALSGTVAFRPVSDYEVVSSTPGTSALIDLSGGGTLTAALPAEVTTATATAFSASVTVDLDTATMSGDLNLLEVHTPGGTFERWVLRLTTGLRTRVVAITSAGAETVVADALGVTTSFVTMDFSVWQNGANIDAGVQWFESLGHFAADGSVAGTLTGATTIKVNSTGVTQTPALPCGHLTMWAMHPAPTLDDPRISYEDETVSARLARLCVEEGVTLTIPAVSTEFDTAMGPQPPADFMTLLYECADADQGVLYESGFGLGYLPREHRYNRSVVLALDFATGQIAEPPEPADDDQQLRNRVIVRRSGGSSGIAEDATSISEVGLYQDEVTVNHSDDSQLADHAAWRVHLGS